MSGELILEPQAEGRGAAFTVDLPAEPPARGLTRRVSRPRSPRRRRPAGRRAVGGGPAARRQRSPNGSPATITAAAIPRTGPNSMFQPAWYARMLPRYQPARSQRTPDAMRLPMDRSDAPGRRRPAMPRKYHRSEGYGIGVRKVRCKVRARR